MGRVSRQVAQAIAAAGTPPRGVHVMPMGQLPPMVEMFEALGIGLVVAVFVILLLLAAYFQSPRHGSDLDRCPAGSPDWCRHHPLPYGNDIEHRVVHGHDHVPGRLRIELCLARDLHARALEGWNARERGRGRRRRRTPAADSYDGLRNDRRHGANVVGVRARKPDGDTARPSGHWWAGHVDGSQSLPAYAGSCCRGWALRSLRLSSSW